jgi:hypothetical protein
MHSNKHASRSSNARGPTADPSVTPDRSDAPREPSSLLVCLCGSGRRQCARLDCAARDSLQVPPPGYSASNSTSTNLAMHYGNPAHLPDPQIIVRPDRSLYRTNPALFDSNSPADSTTPVAAMNSHCWLYARWALIPCRPPDTPPESLTYLAMRSCDTSSLRYRT